MQIRTWAVGPNRTWLGPNRTWVGPNRTMPRVRDLQLVEVALQDLIRDVFAVELGNVFAVELDLHVSFETNSSSPQQCPQPRLSLRGGVQVGPDRV